MRYYLLGLIRTPAAAAAVAAVAGGVLLPTPHTPEPATRKGLPGVGAEEPEGVAQCSEVALTLSPSELPWAFAPPFPLPPLPPPPPLLLL